LQTLIQFHLAPQNPKTPQIIIKYESPIHHLTIYYLFRLLKVSAFMEPGQ